MARRKKEPSSVHREKIASAASVLFIVRGIAATSMDDIAKAALYVYFENKEEIVGILVMDSMKKLYHYIVSALEQQETSKEQYNFVCRGLVSYQEEFPFYFKMVLDKIKIDFESCDYLPEEKETYQIGEEINVWGMLSGFIQLTANKEEYIKKMGLSKIQFLEYGFHMLYYFIADSGE